MDDSTDEILETLRAEMGDYAVEFYEKHACYTRNQLENFFMLYGKPIMRLKNPIECDEVGDRNNKKLNKVFLALVVLAEERVTMNIEGGDFGHTFPFYDIFENNVIRYTQCITLKRGDKFPIKHLSTLEEFKVLRDNELYGEPSTDILFTTSSGPGLRKLINATHDRWTNVAEKSLPVVGLGLNVQADSDCKILITGLIVGSENEQQWMQSYTPRDLLNLYFKSGFRSV